ncbi:MAG: hypothetical protein KH116_12935 [Clostridium sp.]|nr:hypothetical protein [Clostridium sp.]
MMQITDSKKWDIGSASLILSIFGAMFSFTSWNEKTLGEHFFDLIGISLPVGVISLIILFISLFIGYKFKNDYFAKLGTTISIIFILIIFALTITSVLF